MHCTAVLTIHKDDIHGSSVLNGKLGQQCAKLVTELDVSMLSYFLDCVPPLVMRHGHPTCSRECKVPGTVWVSGSLRTRWSTNPPPLQRQRREPLHLVLNFRRIKCTESWK